ncbi:MAG: hypothetical protein N4A64_00495 [Marinisporobacter sp.]|nr:hypothetical protein [Marinisporobacter sp.]
MKKKCILILILLSFTGITVFAGDIPESLMSGNQKALFIGKLTDKDSETYTITPVTVMMGSISQKEIKVNKFEKYYGTSDVPQNGDILVAVLLEKGKIKEQWVFKTTSDDYKTLKLKSVKHNMVKRYEKYINEGKYFEAQNKINEEAKKKNQTTKGNVPLESKKEKLVQNSKSTIVNSIQKNTSDEYKVLLGLLVVVSIFYNKISKK